MNDLQELYQQVIIDHNHNPRNFREINHPSHFAKGHNPLCGDKIDIYLTIEKDKITEVGFTGSGCAISKASSSLMTEALVGKTIAEAEKLFDSVHDMITNGKSNVDVAVKDHVVARDGRVDLGDGLEGVHHRFDHEDRVGELGATAVVDESLLVALSQSIYLRHIHFVERVHVG